MKFYEHRITLRLGDDLFKYLLFIANKYGFKPSAYIRNLLYIDMAANDAYSEIYNSDIDF